MSKLIHKYPGKLILIALIGLGVLVYVIVKPQTQSPKESLTGLPWQINLHNDGTSSVFGLTLETTTVAEAIAILGVDHELAIISDQQDHSGLEIYYSHFSSGPLQAKLVIGINAKQAELKTMQAKASKSNYMDSGSRQFLLNSADLEQIQSWTIKNLSLIPSANLDEDVIRHRFGQPEYIVTAGKEIRHFLYPRQGLDIVVNPKAKEVLQYVAPRSFAQLSEPLRSLHHSGT